MTFALRDAALADADPLSAMARASFLETFGPLYAPDDLELFLEDAFGAHGLPAQIDDPGYSIRIAEADGAIVGFAKVAAMTLPIRHPAGAMELKQLYVLRPHHGGGLGPALMDWAIAIARNTDAPALYLSVYAENARALAFYRRVGFVEVGFAPFTVGGKVDVDPVMMLDLVGAE